MTQPERRPERARIVKAMRGLTTGTVSPDAIPADVLELIQKMTKQSPEALAAWGRRKREREQRSPRPGTPAPDFELERLAPDGKRTGEMLRLSSHRGERVALIFGSYT